MAAPGIQRRFGAIEKIYSLYSLDGFEVLIPYGTA
jgi:hypothetical protein